jgi:type II secretory pathway pseudopilin PulG
MPKLTVLSGVLQKKRRASFTLVELLTVIAIIAILCALTLTAASGLWAKSLRSRAAGEIKAMSGALEGYKIDNAIYPNTNVATGTVMSSSPLVTNTAANPYFSTLFDGTGANYKKTSQVLFLALSGQTNFTDIPGGAKVYMTFKRNQVGDPNGTSTGASYIQDPWGYSYAYSIGTGGGGATTNYPYNGNGFYDLWSTGGTTTNAPNANVWINNWQQ